MEQIINLLCAGGVLISCMGGRGRVSLSVQGTQRHSKSSLSVGLFLHLLLTGGFPGALARACRSRCLSPSWNRDSPGPSSHYAPCEQVGGRGRRVALGPDSSVLCTPQVSVREEMAGGLRACCSGACRVPETGWDAGPSCVPWTEHPRGRRGLVLQVLGVCW